MMHYNSTRGTWTGFTAFSIEAAKKWNNPFEALRRETEAKLLCADNLHAVRNWSNHATTPTVKLNSLKQSAVLVCSAYNFYPKQIQMTWWRNEQELTTGVSYSEVMPSGGWYYQSHSYLEYTQTAGESISCKVEHFSLSEPLILDWDPSLPVTDQFKIGVGLCALILGLVVVSTGFIYYKKKSAAYTTLCRGRVKIPVEHLPAADVMEQSEKTALR